MSQPHSSNIAHSFLLVLSVALFISSIAGRATDLTDLKPEQQAEIVAKKGEAVRVKGKVTRVSSTSSGSITFVNFEGVRIGGFSGVVRKDDVLEIEKKLGGALGVILTGKEVVLKGTVSIYEGKPQIEVRDSSQIEIDGQTTPPSASDVPVITDTATLRQLKGKSVKLVGVVRKAGASSGGGLVLISFEGVSSGGFMAVVASSHLPSVEDAVGGNLDAALPGRKVAIKGMISLYGEVPQIEIKTGDQIEVIP